MEIQAPTLSRQRDHRILYHAGFWMLSYFFLFMLLGSTTRDYKTAFVFVTLLFPIPVALTWLLNYYLIPKYYLNGREKVFFLLLAYLIIITGWLAELVCLFTFITIAGFQVDKMLPASFDPMLLIVGIYFIVLLAVIVKQVRRMFRIQEENNSLKEKRMEVEIKLKEAELKLLKAQIHPHFLFNTLNNLYGLTLEKSDMAPDIVLRISDLLDYMLYQSNKSLVKLEDEITYIRNYTQIEKIRYANSLSLLINISGEMDGLLIAPMLLIPFIENAFKHGASQIISNPFIHIDIAVKNEMLSLKVKNSIVAEHEPGKGLKTGIGLENVRKRLELLYSGKHELKINSDKSAFEIELRLILNSISNDIITTTHEIYLSDRG